MKSNLLKQGLFNACALTILLLPAAVQAQDAYWFLNDNVSQGQTNCLNTTTQTVVTAPGFANYYTGAHPRTVYDASGSEVFSYGTVETSKSTSFITLGGNQAFRIPGKCKQYYLMTVTNNSAHVGIVSLTLIDASGGGLPVAGNGIGLTQLGAYHYGAVAARPEPDGRRYIYCLSADGVNTAVCNLVRFTIQANGSFGPSNVYATIATNLPLCPENARMKMAPDGNSLGYTNVNGQLVTVQNLTTPTPTVTSYNKTALGMAEVTVSMGSRRWYVSTGTELGYFTEGNTTFTTISNSTTGSYGINSDIAQSSDGTVYVAKGNPAIGAGTLTYFSPYVTTPVFNTISGTQISGVNNVNTPTAYSFGSNVEGEDNNVSQPVSLSNLTLNNMPGGTVNAPDTIWACPGATSLQLRGAISQYSSYNFSWQYGNYVNGVFTGGPLLYIGQTPGPFSSYNIPYNPGSTRDVIKVTFFVYGVCGDQISQTRYYVIKQFSLLADYFKPGCTASISCPKPIQTTLPITTAAPTPSPTPTTFKNNIDNAIGYMGANSCGMVGINTNGTWTVSVYEVDDTTGIRKIRSGMPATTIVYASGLGQQIGSVSFDLTSYAFDPSIGPSYCDQSVGTGYGGYFTDFYTWAKANGTLTSDFGTRVYCVEMVVVEPTWGCSVTKKSYFKIATNGTFNYGANARPAPGDEENTLQASIYPNPVSTTLSITIPAGTTQASVTLLDNLGRLVIEHEDLRIGKNSIDMQRLHAGVYFYNLSVNGKIQHGKIVKQ